MTDTRINVVVMGRTIGTADGWDSDSPLVLTFYDYKPAPTLAAFVDVAEGDAVHIDFGGGWIEHTNATTGEIKSVDLVPFLLNVLPDADL